MRKGPILFYTLKANIVLYLKRDYYVVSTHPISLGKDWLCELTVRASVANFDFNLSYSITGFEAYRCNVR